MIGWLALGLVLVIYAVLIGLVAASWPTLKAQRAARQLVRKHRDAFKS